MRDCLKTRKLTCSGLLLLFLLVVIFPLNLQAQDVAVGQALATVMASLTVVSLQDLDFGNILQGVTETVTRTDAIRAGIFQITGESAANTEVSMYFQLPDYLWNSAAGSQDRLVIYFQNTDCTIDTTNGTPLAPGVGALIGENPHSMPDTGIGGNDGVVRIYLGGSVYPTVDQRAGAYSADIVLTTAYTGD
ncbi:MAG: hypothetical protein GY855_13335 [candidate division Zixibacteria bacterium]|nr:hypothetical protein [candidate division Zixibacteria bacterium]